MITVLWWFVYRRWKFKRWTKDIRDDVFTKTLLLGNARITNIARCRDYPAIHRDMRRILGMQ